LSKSIQISNSKKIRPVRTELFHADMMKLTAAYRSFERAPKKRSPSPLLFSKDKEYNYMDKPIFASSGGLSVAFICSESWK